MEVTHKNIKNYSLQFFTDHTITGNMAINKISNANSNYVLYIKDVNYRISNHKNNNIYS